MGIISLFVPFGSLQIFWTPKHLPLRRRSTEKVWEKMSTTRRLGCSIAKSILGSKGQPRKENPFEPHLRLLIVQHFCESVEPIGELYSRTSSCRHAVCQCERLMIPTANFSNLSQVKTLCTYQDLHCFTNKDPGSARSPLSSLALDARDHRTIESLQRLQPWSRFEWVKCHPN